MPDQSTLQTVLLSALLPGLGQWVAGQRAKGAAFGCTALGILAWLAIVIFGPLSVRSGVSQLMLGITYGLVWIPAVLDAARGGSSAQPTSLSTHPWYVMFMVLMVGAMAIPLVWQSRLSRRAKIAWSVVGIVNTLLALLMLVVVGPIAEQWLREASGALEPPR